MSANSSQEHTKPELLLAILALVVAGVVQVTVSDGPFNFWNVMLAILLGGILYMYPVTRRQDILPLACTWGFVVLMGTGILLQPLYAFLDRFIPGPLNWLKWLSPPPANELTSAFFFIVWALYSFAIYLFFRRRLSPKMAPSQSSVSTPEHEDPQKEGLPEVLSVVPQESEGGTTDKNENNMKSKVSAEVKEKS